VTRRTDDYDETCSFQTTRVMLAQRICRGQPLPGSARAQKSYRMCPLTRFDLRSMVTPSFSATPRIRFTQNTALRGSFNAQALFNPHWGEQIGFRPGGVVTISMVFQGLGRQEAEAVWRPFFDWVAASPQDFAIVSAPRIGALPAQRFWDPSLLKSVPGLGLSDDREGAPADNIFWAGNLEEAGAVWHAYQSAWLPASLLEPDQRERFVDTLFAAAQHWGVTLHVNKGLAGGAPEAIAAARETAMNPAVVDAFALVISGALEQPAYPGVPGHEPDAAVAQSQAQATDRAMNEIRKLLPRVGSYVWETDFFQPNWQDAFWGENYARLSAVKDKHDPAGLFFVHHGVGSENWSADGFTRLN
jgi:hypothetical protein